MIAPLTDLPAWRQAEARMKQATLYAILQRAAIDAAHSRDATFENAHERFSIATQYLYYFIGADFAPESLRYTFS